MAAPTPLVAEPVPRSCHTPTETRDVKTVGKIAVSSAVVLAWLNFEEMITKPSSSKWLLVTL